MNDDLGFGTCDNFPGDHSDIFAALAQTDNQFPGDHSDVFAAFAALEQPQSTPSPITSATRTQVLNANTPGAYSSAPTPAGF